MSVQLRKLNLLIQHFMILQLRHATFITQSLKEIHSGRETGLIDTGPLRDYFTFQSMTLTSDSRLRLFLSEMIYPLDSLTNYLQ